MHTLKTKLFPGAHFWISGQVLQRCKIFDQLDKHQKCMSAQWHVKLTTVSQFWTSPSNIWEEVAKSSPCLSLFFSLLRIAVLNFKWFWLPFSCQQVSIHLKNWSHVLSYVTKAESSPELSEVSGKEQHCRYNELRKILMHILSIPAHGRIEKVKLCKLRKFPASSPLPSLFWSFQWDIDMNAINSQCTKWELCSKPGRTAVKTLMHKRRAKDSLFMQANLKTKYTSKSIAYVRFR